MSDTNNQEILKLINSSQDRLFCFILSICPNRDLTEDILQETNRVLWQKREKFELGTSFVAWAFQVAKNQTLAHLKSNRRKQWLLFDTEFVEAVARRSEEREGIWEQKVKALRGCLATLNGEEQSVVQCRYRQRHSIREIASELEKSEPAIKQLLFRVRNKLKACIERKLMAE